MAQTDEPRADLRPPPGYIEQLREHTKSDQHKLDTWDDLLYALREAVAQHPGMIFARLAIEKAAKP